MSNVPNSSQGQDQGSVEESLRGRLASWSGFQGKTLWDLLVLFIIPLSLALVALLFNRSQSSLDRQIAEDRRREETLQSYLGRMEHLILEQDLRSAGPASEASILARAVTTTALRELDGRRKGALLLFLLEAGLLDKVNPVLDLQNANFSLTVLFAPELSGLNLRKVSFSGADLKEAKFVDADLSSAYLQHSTLIEADLTGADLSGANLMGAKLMGATLTGADLTGANLEGVDLRGAIVSREQLEQVRSLEGATMPDGEPYEGEFDR